MERPRGDRPDARRDGGPSRPSFARLAGARGRLALGIQLLLIAALVVILSLGNIWPILWTWLLFAVHALAMPVLMWGVDGPATLRTFIVFLLKLLLALAPVAMLIVRTRRWRVFGVAYAVFTIIISVAFVRACPSIRDWVALVLLSAFATVLVRYRFLRWTVVLPLIVLVALPAWRHQPQNDGAELSRVCEKNDGERPSNLDPDQFSPRYHGVRFIPPDWVLLIGESAGEGQFLNIPHRGRGSWWLRKQPDGGLVFYGPSSVTGNMWTSCMLGDDAWIIKAGWFLRVRPPGPDGRESVTRYPFEMIGFDAPDTACDARTGTVFGSDLLDGRLLELSERTGWQPRRRPDYVSRRGGLMSMRERDGRLVIFDFQDLIVYDPEESRVLQRTPAAIVSSSLAVCQLDGSVAIPDLAGRLRVFRMNAEGTYDFDFGVGLFAPRFAAWSPDCAFIGVTSADDDRVWVIDRASQRIVATYHLGPAMRGVTFIGPRELAVADACTVSVLRF